MPHAATNAERRAIAQYYRARAAHYRENRADADAGAFVRGFNAGRAERLARAAAAAGAAAAGIEHQTQPDMTDVHPELIAAAERAAASDFPICPMCSRWMSAREELTGICDDCAPGDQEPTP
jgi:hypothetical protein